jgi:hypothetical protein
MAARKARVRRGQGLVLVAGEKPQMRQPSARSWTKDKETVFLTVLAETCNVTRACEAADVGVTSAYRHKKENAAFRSGWLAAISVAYQQLELVLLERAFVGTEKLVSVRGGEPQAMREYSNTLGLTLLRMHRDTAVAAETEFQPDQIEELRERLFKKLRRLKQRCDEDEGEGR